MAEQLLPLFPLNTVLFPHMYLPLHIFEERYKLLINTVLQGNATFGILLVSDVDGELRPCDIGTIGRITEMQRLSGGRMNIMIQGVSRFRVSDYDTNMPYLRGLIEPLDDEDAGRPLPQLVGNVSNLFGQYLNALLAITSQEPRQITLPDTPDILSYVVADGLQIEWDQKQDLLETVTARSRLEQEASILQREVLMLTEFKTVPRRLVDTEISFSLN